MPILNVAFMIRYWDKFFAMFQNDQNTCKLIDVQILILSFVRNHCVPRNFLIDMISIFATKGVIVYHVLFVLLTEKNRWTGYLEVGNFVVSI